MYRILFVSYKLGLFDQKVNPLVNCWSNNPLVACLTWDRLIMVRGWKQHVKSYLLFTSSCLVYSYVYSLSFSVLVAIFSIISQKKERVNFILSLTYELCYNWVLIFLSFVFSWHTVISNLIDYFQLSHISSEGKEIKALSTLFGINREKTYQKFKTTI